MIGRLIRPLIILVVLAGAIVGAMQWINNRPAAREASAPAPRPAAGQRPAPLVRTLVVDQTRLVEQSTFPADVRASATADIASRMAGRLGAVLVKEGSSVGSGSLVARIDDPELELTIRQADAAVEVQRARLAQLRAGPRPQEVAQAEATVAQAETSLAQAERELNRAQQLFTDGLVARAAVDRAQTDTELSRARLRAAQEQLALVRQGPRAEDIETQVALVRQAEAQAAAPRARLRDLRITSPIAGVVTRVNVEPGAVISTQTVVATVATIRPVEVHVPLPETDLPRLRKTTVVRIRVDALPDRLFEGGVARIAPAFDAASRSVRLVVVLPNGDLALRPGMFARATVVFDERPALMIPSDAVVRRGEAALVFVVKDDTVEERTVRAGYVEGNSTEIREGLQPGEAIVVAGQLGLRDGMRVRTGAGGRPSPGPGDDRGGPSPGPGGTQPAPSPSPRRPAP